MLSSLLLFNFLIYRPCISNIPKFCPLTVMKRSTVRARPAVLMLLFYLVEYGKQLRDIFYNCPSHLYLFR